MTNKVNRSPETLMIENRVVKHLAGSRAYGTATPESDWDYRGVFCADPVNHLTPFFAVNEVADSQEEDSKYYELSHFMKMCLECNPNIIETLWVHPDDIIETTPAYNFLRKHRHELLSKKIAHTTCGYAFAQLKRIKGHNKWIMNPQKEEPPKQCDYLSLVQYFGTEKVLTLNVYDYMEDHRLVPYGSDVFGVYKAPGYLLFSEDGALNKVFEGKRHELGTPLMIVKFNAREYQLDKDKHKQYWNWKQNRNEKRSELEELYGYDVKHAMHLVRLLRMGQEALEEGVIKVRRPDAEELLLIRNGLWSYEECISYAESMDKLIRNKLYKTSPLPKSPNLHRAAEILMETQRLVWESQREGI